MSAEAKSAEPVKLTKDKSECPVDTVTVFSDRAEVTRIIKLDIEEAADFEVLVEDLPDCVDQDSVRVNGTGHVVLREVSYGVHHKVVAKVVATDDNAESVEVIQQSLEAMRKEVAALQQRVSEVDRTASLLETYANNMISKSQVGNRTDATADSLAASMEFAFNLIERSQAKRHELNAQRAELQGQIEAKEKLIAVAKARLTNFLGQQHQGSTTKVSRDVTVAFQAKRAGPVELKLIYMVSRASWSPAYDARIASDENALSLTYYGMVRQRTGESWKNAKLVLSTATPSVGGSAPVLPTKHVGFHARVDYSRARLAESLPRSAVRHQRRGRAFVTNMQSMAFAAPSAPSSGAGGAPPPPAEVATSTVESSGAATTFHVERRTTIANDNKPHKVTVAILNLASAFRHYAVPALNAVAYLQCMTTNTSSYTLLASEQVNVFVDNSFISKTKLNVVAPGESFRTFLGVDKSVKVTYRPVSNVHRERGYFTKTEDTVYKFVTTVKNTKSKPISMVVADMLPVSDDTTIKVKLIQPTREEVDAGTKAEAKQKAAAAGGAGSGAGAGAAAHGDMVAQVKLTNNLVWTRALPAGGACTIPFEYTVEHPGGQSVVTYDRMPTS